MLCLSAVCPSNPDLVYFALEQRLFGVNVPVHKVVEAADEAHELVNMPWPAPASCRYDHAWNLPPWVARGIITLFSSSTALVSFFLDSAAIQMCW